MKTFALCLLLAVIVVCGCLLTLKTGREEYFSSALVAAVVLGFFGLIATNS